MSLHTKVQLNKEALEIAKETLGVKRGVKIWMRHAIHIGGRYHYYRNGKHFITISNHNQGAVYMTKSAWHELTHAAQVERLGKNAFSSLYKAQLAEIGLTMDAIAPGKALDLRYCEIPLEKEAYDNEILFLDHPFIFESKYVNKRKSVIGKRIQALEIDL